MGAPLFKSSEGGRFEVLRVWKDITESEIPQVSGLEVLIRLKVRPEAFPSGSPMPVWSVVCDWRLEKREGGLSGRRKRTLQARLKASDTGQSDILGTVGRVPRAVSESQR